MYKSWGNVTLKTKMSTTLLWNHTHNSSNHNAPSTPVNSYYYHPHAYQPYPPSSLAHYTTYPGFSYPNQPEIPPMTPTPTRSPPQPPLQFQAYRPPLGDTTTSVINSQPTRKRKAANKSSNTANKRQRQTMHTTATEPAPAISESRESTPEVSPFQPSVYGVGPAILPTIIPPPPPVQIYGSHSTARRSLSACQRRRSWSRRSLEMSIAMWGVVFVREWSILFLFTIDERLTSHFLGLILNGRLGRTVQGKQLLLGIIWSVSTRQFGQTWSSRMSLKVGKIT